MSSSDPVPRPRVLVAEDDPGLLEVVSALLSESGYDVIAESSGTRAIETLRRTQVDIVLTDIMMPDATGVDVLRAVRERQLDMPVILMTGNPTVPTAVEAVSLGALKYLVKPVAEATLLASVSEALSLARLARLRREALAELGDARVVADRAGLEAALARARRGLWLAYQPVVWARSGALFGREALLRTSDLAVASASAFLDVAERLGGVAAVGRQVRARVAEALAASRDTVLVNLHPQELVDPQLLAPGNPLAGFADRVVLEITERAPLDGIPDLHERVRWLRDQGYRLAIDDLGAGYAALSSFASLEPDLVKLDMSFVRNVHRQPTKRKLVSAIVELCRDLGILVVAEGIESAEERDVMLDAGCDLLQGFYFGRPQPWPQPAAAPSLPA